METGRVGVWVALCCAMACSKPWQRQPEWDRIDVETRADVANEAALAGVPDPRTPSTAGIRGNEPLEVVITDVVGGRTSTRSARSSPEFLEVFPAGSEGAPVSATRGSEVEPGTTPTQSGGSPAPSAGGSSSNSGGAGSTSNPSSGNQLTSRLGAEPTPNESPVGEPAPSTAAPNSPPAGQSNTDPSNEGSTSKQKSPKAGKGAKKQRSSRSASKSSKKSKSTARNAPKKSKKRPPLAASGQGANSQPSLLSQVAKHVRVGLTLSGGRSSSRSSRSSSRGIKIKPRVSLTL
jgi:hypothetical protein